MPARTPSGPTIPNLPSIPVSLALLLRVALFNATSLADIFANRIELSTPLSSIRYLKDGVFLYKSGLNPYEGGTFHHSPPYLLIASIIPLTTSRITASIIYTLSDYLAASSLRNIWCMRKWEEEAQLKRASDDEGRGGGKRRWLRGGWEDAVMLLYLLNPYTIGSCLAQSTTSFDNTLVLLAISSAAQGQSPLTTFYLSLATHTSLYPVLLLPALILLLNKTNRQVNDWKASSGAVLFFLGFFLAETALGYGLIGDWSWAAWTWGSTLSVSDLTPNVGLNWYFFTEMFDHFRTFFVGAFQMHIAIYVAPLCIRLHDQPLLAIAVTCGIISTFKSYPTLGDASLWLGLLGCFPEIWPDLRHPLLSVSLQLYSTILLPILHSLWLESGTGNANFFYAATLVHGLGCGMAIVDMLGAGLRHEVARKVIEIGLLDEPSARPPRSGDGAELKSARGILEDHDLVVVQYAGLGS